jgi:DNA mismatch repair ATPase MutL
MTVSRDALKKIQVIGQVDSKFILAKEGSILYAAFHPSSRRLQLTPPPPNQSYILDQHAIDERIGLENLELEAWGSDGEPRNVKQLAMNFEFTTSAHEAELLQRYRARVEAWGWKASIECRCCSRVSGGVCSPAHTVGVQGRR